MLSQQSFDNALAKFESALTASLETLLAFKGGKPTADLPRLQPVLYHALLNLTRGYHELRKERERLIARKSAISPRWHAKRQKQLATRQEVVLSAIRMGRALGDAFVWFFYRNEPSLLNEHLKQPAPSLPPTGDGGEGELALIDAVRFLGERYILFHGITTMFRLGDATLVDLKTGRIDGIGELKTQRIGPKQLSLQFVVSMHPRVKLKTVAQETRHQAHQPSMKQQAQLDRQLARISKAAATAEKPAELKMEVHSPEMAYVREINDIVRSVKDSVGKVEAQQVSPGLLLVAYAPRKRTLASRLADSNSVPIAALDPVPELAKALLPSGMANNMLIISRAFYGEDGTPVVLPGATPMLMWPLDSEVQRALATGTVGLLTVFNPAHLFASFQERGWSLGACEPPRRFSLKRDWNGQTLELHRVEYFLQLVSHSLHRETYVLQLITDAFSYLEREGVAPEMSLDISHRVFF